MMIKVRAYSILTFFDRCSSFVVHLGIPEENFVISKPVFFAAALRDYANLAPSFIASVQQNSNASLVIHEYDTGRWVMMEDRDQLNSDLLQWIEGLDL